MQNGTPTFDVPTPSGDAVSETMLYFVRHGETEYNRKRIVQGGGIDSVLNDTGRHQAAALARRLASTAFDAVYSSPLRRARQTASILAEPHDAPRHEHAGLAEMAWGVFEGRAPSDDRDDALQAIYAEWQAGVFDRPVEGGESILDVQRRGVDATRHILDAHAGQTVLVVSHGRFLRVLLATLLDDVGLRRMHELGHDNTCVNRIRYRDGRFDAEILNCTAHLR